MAMSTASTVPKLQAPAGTCDTHMHIYGPEETYPLAGTGAAVVPGATVDAYRAVQQRLGLERTVIVQAAAYGTDNRCTLDAIAAIGEAARGVAVVDTGVDDAELERLTGLGVRGARLFMVSGGVLSWDDLGELLSRVNEFGWHGQLQMHGRELTERLAEIRSWPGNLVIDHVGRFEEPIGTDHPAFKALMSLVEGGRCWVKLSGVYLSSGLGHPAYEDVGILARALAEAAPERMLWASDWPHPSEAIDPPDDAMLLDVLLHWFDDEALRQRILVDNPAQLYGFD